MLKKILGKNIYIQRLEQKDYKKLYSLRKKKSLTKFLNKISNNAIDQKKFIIDEKKKRNYLFGIYNLNNDFIGTISIYNISKDKKAEWGRWICIGDQKQSLEAIILILKFGYEFLKLKTIFSRTLSKNEKVVNMHKSLGFKIKCENFYDFYISKEHYNSIVHFSEIKNYRTIIKKISKIINF